MVDNIIQCALFSQTYKNLEKVVPHHQQNKACFLNSEHFVSQMANIPCKHFAM